MLKLIIIILFTPVFVVAQSPDYYIRQVIKNAQGNFDTTWGKTGVWDTNYIRRYGNIIPMGKDNIREFIDVAYVSGISLGSIEVLGTVGSITTLSNAAADVVIVTDTVRGGRFVKYTGADAADGGMIFTDALGGKWKRVITDGISIAWYGAATAQTGVNNRNYICNARVSTQYDNTTTTLGNVTGLTANVAAGKIYRFEAKLYTTSDVAGGIKVAIGGTATATAIRYEGLTTDAGLTTQSRSAALGTAVGAVTAAYVTITGTITVNAAGTLTVQAAANAATGTTSVLTGSTFVITEML